MPRLERDVGRGLADGDGHGGRGKLQLLLDRDAHGNVAVSKIETEKLLAGMVELELARRAKQGTYDGHFMTQFHFFGYDGRSGLPSNFDNNYCYAMGATASALLQQGTQPSPEPSPAELRAPPPPPAAPED